MIGSPYPWSDGRRTRRRLALGAVAALAVLAGRRFTRVVVEGPSMLPALAPGERLLVLRTPALDEGDIAAFADPAEPERLLVKRVVRLEATTIEVAGDNPAASRDSRHFGPVPRRLVVGRVIYRYHPGQAAGRLRPAGAQRHSDQVR